MPIRLRLAVLFAVGTAALIVLSGYANAILLALLWSIYMSIVHVGNIWYGYGWEIQLTETARTDRLQDFRGPKSCTRDQCHD